MATERYARVKSIYYAAFELEDVAAQRAYVTEASEGDEALAAEVLKLLGYADDARSPVVTPGGFNVAALLTDDALLAAPATVSEIMPERIAGYRVLRRLGAGGMGVVYEAEQETPRRRVALKVMRPSVVGEDAMARFRGEAETLGRLQHPSVAQVYEARHDAAGCFIAMEYVDGRTFDAWVAEERPSRELLLKTLALVCDGVHHAHMRGVIHRDLKPGNVLVDRTGLPKIIDFGIARASAADGTFESRTQFGEILGTLAYMSPEQAAGDPAQIDVRSDVYALGVLAYQALLGALPNDLARLGLHEAVRAVVATPATRPSAHDPSFPRDLETVLLAALDKDRERRYRSAATLADDLRAFLEARPISAHPPSGWYQLKMYARRHRTIVVSAVLLTLSILGGSLASLHYAFAADASANASDKSAGLAMAKAAEAERSNYAALIRSAAAAVDAARAAEAERLLDATPPALRGFEYDHLRARLAGAERVISGAEPHLDSAAFAADGRLVLGAASGLVRLVDPKLGGETTFAAGAGLCALDASRIRSVIAAGFADGVAIVFDLTGAPLAERAFGGGAIALVALDPAADKLFVETNSKRRFIWDWRAERAEELQWSRANLVLARSVAWSADGARLAAIRARDGSIFEIATFDEATNFFAGDLHTTSEPIRALDYSPDGRYLAVGTRHPSIHVLELATERMKAYIRGPFGPFVQVRWLPDSERLVAADGAGGVALFEVGRTEPLRRFLGHSGAVGALAVDRDGTFVAATGGGVARIWRLDGGSDTAEQDDHRSYVWTVAFNPSGDLLASAAWDGTLRVFDGWSLDPIRVLDRGIKAGPRGLAWSADGATLRLLARDVRSYDIPGAGLENGRDDTAETDTDEEPGADDATEPALELASAPDGLEASPAHAPIAADWSEQDVAWPGVVVQGGMPRGPGGALSIRRAGNARGRGGIAIVAPEMEFAASLPAAPSFWVYSRDGRSVAIGLADGRIAVFVVGEGERFEILDGVPGGVYALAFSPDGSRLAGGGRDRTVRLWETTHWTEAAVLHGHTGDVRALTFSPDGRRLASGSSDRTVRLWSTEPRQTLVERSDKARLRRAATSRPATNTDDKPSASDRIRAAFEAAPESEDRRETPSSDRAAGPAGSGFGSALAVLHRARSTATTGVLIGSASAVPLQTGAVELRSPDLKTVLYRIHGGGPAAGFGRALLTLSDEDGDDVEDFVVGAPGDDRPGLEDCGSLTFVSGATGAVLRTVYGESKSAALGSVVTRVGDLDGDGLDDVAADERQFTERAGKAWSSVARIVSARTGKTLWKSVPFLQHESVAAVSDQDGDGVRDLVVPTSPGEMTVFSGRSGRPVSAMTLPKPEFRRRRGNRPEASVSLVVVDGGGPGRAPTIAVGWSQTAGPAETPVEIVGGSSQAPWSRLLPPLRTARRIEPLPDLDGDGDAEIGVRIQRGDSSYGGRGFLVLSGKTGAVMRSFEAGPDERDFAASFAVDAATGFVYFGAPTGNRPSVSAFPLAPVGDR